MGNNGPLAIFGDFGLVGGQDVAPDPQQNAQICINFYPEVDQKNPKEVVALLGTPGLTQLVAAPGGGAPGFSSTWPKGPLPSSVTNLPVRGCWVLPGGTTALVVIGATLYLMTIVTPANATSFPTSALPAVGTLLTSSGAVSIADDNGVGLGVSGTIVGLAVLVDGTYGYTYNYLTNTFAQITDPNFHAADRVFTIDGWFIFNWSGTQAFFMPTQQYSVTFGSYYALKDASSDNLGTIGEVKEQLWLVGERTTEIWYDQGGQYFPFARLVGTVLQYGCKATHSIAKFSSGGQDGLIWYGRSERGENTIVRTHGFSATKVSDAAFGDEVATYPITSDAIGSTYQEDAHLFYVLTFPTADVTWVCDSQSGMLHKRPSYDPYAQLFHRHRSTCFMNFQGLRIRGDYQNGALYQLTRSAYTDAGWPILAQRRSPHVWDKGQRGRVAMYSLQADWYPGVGNASGMGSNPQCTLRISRDAGRTFGQGYNAPMGAIGATRTRTMWRRLGVARDAVFDLQVIDPVRRDLIGCTLKAISGA